MISAIQCGLKKGLRALAGASILLSLLASGISLGTASPALPGPVPPPAQLLAPETNRPETIFAPFANAQVPPESNYVPPAPFVREKIARTVGDVKFEGRLLRPAAPKAAVMVIPEWWGLNLPIQKISEELAGWGYLTMAVDLYGGGKVAHNRAEAATLARGVDRKRANEMLKATAGWLQDSATTQTLPVYVVGWGWGGSMGLRFAVQEPRLKGLVLVDAEPITNPESIKKIKCPVLAFFSMRGGWITKEDVDAFVKNFSDAGNKPQVFRFSTNPGALLGPTSLEDQAYAGTVKQRIREFLDRNAGK